MAGKEMHFPSKIIAERHDTPRVRSTIRIEEHGDELGCGYEGAIYRVRVVSDRAPERPITLAHKIFDPSKPKLVDYSLMFRNYRWAKSAGFPVPRTYRSTDDENGILMTDLTEGGKNVVLSRNNSSLKEVRELYEQRPEIMKLFSDAESLQSDTVKEQLKTFAEKAAAIDLYLSADSMFVVIDPSGSYQFMIGDFSLLKTSAEHAKRNNIEVTPRTLLALNKANLEKFRTHISPIQEYGINPEAAAQGSFYI